MAFFPAIYTRTPAMLVVHTAMTEAEDMVVDLPTLSDELVEG
jgi:hypothetical protein